MELNPTLDDLLCAAGNKDDLHSFPPQNATNSTRKEKKRQLYRKISDSGWWSDLVAVAGFGERCPVPRHTTSDTIREGKARSCGSASLPRPLVINSRWKLPVRRSSTVHRRPRSHVPASVILTYIYTNLYKLSKNMN